MSHLCHIFLCARSASWGSHFWCIPVYFSLRVCSWCYIFERIFSLVLAYVGGALLGFILVFMVKLLCLWWRPLSWGSSCVYGEYLSLKEVLVFVGNLSLEEVLVFVGDLSLEVALVIEIPSLLWKFLWLLRRHLSWGISCVLGFGPSLEVTLVLILWKTFLVWKALWVLWCLHFGWAISCVGLILCWSKPSCVER